MLPGLDGVAVARRLRTSGVRIPILMLTASGSVPDIGRGLDAGADDYLTKPLSFEVLTARLRVIARRAASESKSRLQIGVLTRDTETHVVERAGEPIILTRTEFILLEYLMRRAGRVASRDAVIHAVWGIDCDVGSNTPHNFIFHLRSKPAGGRRRRLTQPVRR